MADTVFQNNTKDSPFTLPHRRIRVSNSDLRNGQQCRYATRFTTAEMLPIAEKMDKIGYESMEVWGGASFDACLRYCNDDPWERLRAFKSVMKNTPTTMLLRGSNIVGYQQYPDDILVKFIELAAKNGMDIFNIFDGLNDLRNVELALKTVKRLGKRSGGSLIYTVSPVHTVDLYVEKAKEWEALGVDQIGIADVAGTMTPTIAYELTKALKSAIKIPVSCGGMSQAGMSTMTAWEAMRAGSDRVGCVSACLSGGTASSAAEAFVAALKGTPADTGLDLDLMAEVNEMVKAVGEKHKDTETQFGGVSVAVFSHQIPGGMMSNMESQLRAMNAYDRLEEVCAEVAVVRADLGYPPLATPFSQMTGAQATTNVLTGKRYGIISKEVRNLVAGKYGRTPGPINPELKKMVLGDKEPISVRPASLLPPAWDKAVEESKEFARCEEDVMSYALFPNTAEPFLRRKYGID